MGINLLAQIHTQWQIQGLIQILHPCSGTIPVNRAGGMILLEVGPKFSPISHYTKLVATFKRSQAGPNHKHSQQ